MERGQGMDIGQVEELVDLLFVLCKEYFLCWVGEDSLKYVIDVGVYV